MDNRLSINNPLNFQLPGDVAKRIGERACDLRLAHKLTRQTLSQRCGVPASTIRRFEQTGQIGLVALLQIADVLGDMDEFNALFAERKALTLDQFVAPKRKRGSV